MGTETRRVYTQKNKKIKWGRFVISAVFIAYIIMFVYTFFSQSVETVPISYGDIEISETVDGYITRNEQVVTSNVAGELYPLISEGERVSKGQTIAVVRNENNEEIEEKIKDINNKLNSLSTPGIFNNDILMLDNEVSSTLNGLMLESYNQSFSELSGVREKIESKLSKKSQIIGQASSKGSAERNYYEKLKEYEKKLNETRSELVSPIAGIVAYKLDGYEHVFEFSQIGNYDAETLEKINVPSGELVGSVKPNSLKIVDNIEGYITIISSSERALNTMVDKKVKLKFPEIADTEVTGEIEYMTIEDGKAVITFRLNRAIEELIRYRKVKTEIIWESKTGLKIPSTSIKKEDGKNKIYVLNGNRLIEKYIDVSLEWNNEAIIKREEGYEPYLYDKVVVNAENVNVKKIAISD